MPAHKLSGAVEREIRRLTIERVGQRAIARQLHVSPMTVRRVQSTMQLPACECGQPYGHKGWCEPRKKASPKYLESRARMRQLPQNQPGYVRRQLPQNRPSYVRQAFSEEKWRKRISREGFDNAFLRRLLDRAEGTSEGT